MQTDGQPMLMCNTDNRKQRCIVQQWGTAVQHSFDQVMAMGGGFFDRAYRIRRSGQFPNRTWWSPSPIGRITTYRSEELSSDLDQQPWRRVDLPVTSDARHPAQIMYFDQRGIGQSGGINQAEVNMSINKAGHHGTIELGYAGLLHGRVSECQGTQVPVKLGKDCRSKSMADPKIVHGKPHGYLPISVRTAYSSGKKVSSSAF
jgi:hypothetical protein